MKDESLCKATVLWQQDGPLAVITEGDLVWSLTDCFFIQVVCLLVIQQAGVCQMGHHLLYFLPDFCK